MEDLISVIIPVHNVEKYLFECVDSVLKQTYQNLEILLIDDGSTDGSGNLCDEYAEKDSRIKVVHKENGGVSSARNVGLDLAKGEYITFIDSDDYVSGNYVQALYENLKENGSDLAFCKYAHKYENDMQNSKEHFPSKIIVDTSSVDFIKFFSRFISLKNNIMGACWRILFSREILRGLSFNTQIRIAEDLLFVLQVIKKAKTLSFINKELYFYRINKKSAVHTYRKQYLQGQILLYKKIEDLLLPFFEKKVLYLYGTILCHLCIVNEIKFRCKKWRNNIDIIRKSELYRYYTLKNIFKQGKLSVVIKFLVVWFLVKTRLI
ncbi:MAG: glycosyltransferase [Clostridia bacterium]|nr:glycosyltransferase [Clostridia bacterium]